MVNIQNGEQNSEGMKMCFISSLYLLPFSIYHINCARPPYELDIISSLMYMILLKLIGSYT